MSEWREYKLGDVINVKHGYAFKGEYFSNTPTSDILLTPGNFNIGANKVDAATPMLGHKDLNLRLLA